MGPFLLRVTNHRNHTVFLWREVSQLWSLQGFQLDWTVQLDSANQSTVQEAVRGQIHSEDAHCIKKQEVHKTYSGLPSGAVEWVTSLQKMEIVSILKIIPGMEVGCVC